MVSVLLRSFGGEFLGILWLNVFLGFAVFLAIDAHEGWLRDWLVCLIGVASMVRLWGVG